MLTVGQASAGYQYQYAGDGDGDLLLHISSDQMSPQQTRQPQHSRHTRLGFIKANRLERTGWKFAHCD